MFNWAKRYDNIVTTAWDIWTNTGRDMDVGDIEQTVKSVRDAATNAYIDDITDEAWLKRTLQLLGHQS
jgi:hypothetical protein